MQIDKIKISKKKADVIVVPQSKAIKKKKHARKSQKIVKF
jgi:hypothetical protein